MAWHDWAIIVAGSLLVGWAAFWRGRALASEHERDVAAEEVTRLRGDVRRLSLLVARHEQAAHLVPLRLSQERRIQESRG